ncbi:hypothetical protein NPIL_167111 [Nephila pilipes]|uniref:Uncharacterized protein n=1 Tax=Nephila pilipes TaxID=299642 RepID=A0A8X6TKR5_NEPPI|nr:hypothetical protein NPIL_167111 [Nephila pilipes]
MSCIAQVGFRQISTVDGSSGSLGLRPNGLTILPVVKGSFSLSFPTIGEYINAVQFAHGWHGCKMVQISQSIQRKLDLLMHVMNNSASAHSQTDKARLISLLKRLIYNLALYSWHVNNLGKF